MERRTPVRRTSEVFQFYRGVRLNVRVKKCGVRLNVRVKKCGVRLKVRVKKCGVRLKVRVKKVWYSP